MPLDMDAVGRSTAEFTRTWTREEAILYALGVGAGQLDPSAELAYTTQDCVGVEQRVIPTFATALTQVGLLKRLQIGTYERSALLHADQLIEIRGPLPVAGSVSVTASLDGIHQKAKGALVVISTRAHDGVSGELRWTTRLGYFVRGETGSAEPDRNEPTGWCEPSAAPDASFITSTRADQALLYRLSGDYNPLHSDPVYARRAGFDRPILHGLCTYGVVHRALLQECCGGDVTRVRSMYAQFRRPVTPGDQLQTNVWNGSQGITFRTVDSAGNVVLDKGHFVVD